ncbi:MAG TPA: fluoride efflux transporter CrcB [Gemmatimonadales bacterium]|nr:fluoride efflux transporter CrcB [Gemmatimonadales bacterium]HET7042124.1 fluoride efflux transporter CrcB [Gemmatimonadales bacterium]
MLWYIAVGSAIGGVGRYLLGGLVQRLAAGTFPAGTLFVNVTGSFLLGLILRYAIETPAVTPELRALLTVGLCGGYTTFSTFSYETVALVEDGDWTRAALYITLSLALSLAATFLGFAAAREIVALQGRV